MTDVLVFCLAVVGLTVFVAMPLYGRARGDRPDLPSDVSREAVVQALRDLEIDRESRLLDDASYAAERDALEARLLDQNPASRPSND